MVGTGTRALDVGTQREVEKQIVLGTIVPDKC